MEALYTAPSKEKYMELCCLLIGMVFVICFKYICNINFFLDNKQLKGVQNWAKHKLNKVIAAGINKNCSEIHTNEFKML